MNPFCPNCRQVLPLVGEPCGEPNCRRRGYHAVPAASLQANLDPRIGLQLDGKYLLVRSLGRGGMGDVLVALQQPLLREVALKMIRGMHVSDTARARFVREARAVATLDHPNIVRLVDFGVAELDEIAPYMVMELVVGARSLRDLLADWRHTPPNWGVVGEVFGQLLAALVAAGERNIVHRDIKPDNVMISAAHGYQHFVKVLDFGLAKSFGDPGSRDSDLPSLTEAGTAAGTPQYMAPEQLVGEAGVPIDGRADQYAVGTMLFELVCGRRPYPADLDTIQLIVAKADPRRDPLDDAPELDDLGAVGAVIRRAMSWSVGDRFPSAAVLRKDLLAAITKQGPDIVLPTFEVRSAPRPGGSATWGVAGGDAPIRPRASGVDHRVAQTGTMTLGFPQSAAAVAQMPVLPAQLALGSADGADNARRGPGLLAALAAVAVLVVGWLAVRTGSASTAVVAVAPPVVAKTVAVAAPPGPWHAGAAPPAAAAQPATLPGATTPTAVGLPQSPTAAVLAVVPKQTVPPPVAPPARQKSGPRKAPKPAEFKKL